MDFTDSELYEVFHAVADMQREKIKRREKVVNSEFRQKLTHELLLLNRARMEIGRELLDRGVI